MPHSQHCHPRPSVFATDRPAAILNLDSVLGGQIDGTSFFEENYFTHGMNVLLENVFRHLDGAGAGSSVVLLSKPIGGGKTHSMIELGLKCRSPALRCKELSDQNPASKLVFAGSWASTDATPTLRAGYGAPSPNSWARRTGTKRMSRRSCRPPGQKPGSRCSVGSQWWFSSTIPPYLEYAVAVPVSNADLGVATTAALGNAADIAEWSADSEAARFLDERLRNNEA